MEGARPRARRTRAADEALAAYREGIAVAERKGDKQAGKEMQVFARRLEKARDASRKPSRRCVRTAHAFHAAVGERVGALVARIRGVATHPVPAHACRAAAVSSSRHRSAFLTGFLSAVFQPLRFQPWIHVSMPFFTYCESV